MRSKTSFFSPAVYRKNLTRFAPLYLAYFAFWLVALPLNILSYRTSQGFNNYDLLEEALRNAMKCGVPFTAIYAILVAMALYGWYYQTRSVNALAALPVRREAWFCTNLLTALTVSIGPQLIVALLGLAAAGSMGLAGFSAMAQWFAIVSLLFFFFFALASLCASIVGQMLALPVLYFLLNFTVVVVNYVVMGILSTFVYGMSALGIELSPLSPVFHLLSNSYISYASFAPDPATAAGMEGYDRVPHFERWGYLLGLTVAALVFFAIAYFLFKKRRMESAGDVIAVRPLRPVFKYCFAAGCALVLGTLVAFVFFEGDPNGPTVAVMLLCLLAGGLVGYFTAEILLKKTFRVFRKKAWIGYGALAAGLAALVLLMEFDVTGFERRVPAVDDVKSITVYGSNGPLKIESPELIADMTALHQSIVEHKREQESMVRSFYGGGPASAETGREEARSNVTRQNFMLRYMFKDGRTMERTYNIYCDDALWADPNSLPRRYAALFNDPAMIELAYTLDFPINGPENVSGGHIYNSGKERMDELGGKHGPSNDYTDSFLQAEAYELYTTCVLPDLREGKIGRMAFFGDEEILEREYAAELELRFTEPSESPFGDVRQDWLNVSLTAGSRTAQYFLDRGMPLITRAELAELEEEAQRS